MQLYCFFFICKIFLAFNLLQSCASSNPSYLHFLDYWQEDKIANLDEADGEADTDAKHTVNGTSAPITTRHSVKILGLDLLSNIAPASFLSPTEPASAVTSRR